MTNDDAQNLCREVDHMKVSVVIPLYNRADSIANAIHSALTQTLPIQEVIVVDDGSTDGSAAAVEAIDDPRIRCIQQQNGGAGSARNRGLEVASGDWIAFLDSDDWWTRDRLASAAAALDANPDIDFLQANRLHVYDDQRIDAGLKVPPAHLIDILRQLGGFTIKTSAVMIRRELIERYRLRFPTDQKTCEDYHLFWRALLFARAVGFTEAPEVMIRALPDSLSRGNSIAYLQRDNIKTLIEVREWAREHRAKPSYIQALDAHLHWQLRDYLVMLLKRREFGAVAHYIGVALREEGPARAIRSLLSALKGLFDGAPRVVTR